MRCSATASLLAGTDTTKPEKSPNRYYIAHAAICALAKAGRMTPKDVTRAIKQYKIDTEKPDPVTV